MLSLRDTVGHEAVPSIVALARQGNLAPPFSLRDFISNRFVEIEINVPGGIQLARAGDVEVSHAKVLLRSNGDWAISGSLHDHGTLVGDDFVLNFTALFTVTGSDGVTRGFSAPLIIGRLGAVFGPSRDFNFRSVGNNAFLQQNDFIRAAVRAKTHCTISRLLNANLSMSAKLDNSETRRTPKVRRPMDSLKVSTTKKQSIGRPFPERKCFSLSAIAHMNILRTNSFSTTLLFLSVARSRRSTIPNRPTQFSARPDVVEICFSSGASKTVQFSQT
jgi:hypothetical protein